MRKNRGAGQHFTNLLGNPVAINEVDDVTEYLYKTKYCYVVAQTNAIGGVSFFSVTTRKLNFKPLVQLRSGASVRILGHSTFSSNSSRLPHKRYLTWDHGAPVAYAESYWFGMDGGYRMYFFAFNPNGYGMLRVARNLGSKDVEFPSDKDLSFADSTINTYAISARHGLGSEIEWPSNKPFGPWRVPGSSFL